MEQTLLSPLKGCIDPSASHSIIFDFARPISKLIYSIYKVNITNLSLKYLSEFIFSKIPIDIPDEGDFRFHLKLIGGQSGK